jgi:uncharacterized protein
MSAEALPQQPEAFPVEPFNEFVLKIAARCNMQPQHEFDRDPMAVIQSGCDHCYMYTHSTLWKGEPTFMEPEVYEQAARQIGKHAADHNLTDVRGIAHGGEATLVLKTHPDYFTRFAETLHRHIDPSGANLHLSIQTNGLLLDEPTIGQLMGSRFRIGLSIDGPKTANDLHRRDRKGLSTHDRVEAAAIRLHEMGANWDILGVIDPRTDPEETLEYLASLRPSSINLFPLHAHNSAPPIAHSEAMSLGEWQKRAFERYNDWSQYHTGAPKAPFAMPIYDNYLKMAFGGLSINDTAGERLTRELIVTTGGDWERLDTLKSANDGAVVTGLNIFEHSLDEVARRDPGIIARRIGFEALSPICQGCEVRDLCYAGHYSNRYDAPEEELTPESSVEAYIAAFRNPNVYCKDLKLFLGDIRAKVDAFKGEQERIKAQSVPEEEPVLVGADVLPALPEDTHIPNDVSELVGATVESEAFVSLCTAFWNAAYQEHVERYIQTYRGVVPNRDALWDMCLSTQSFPAPAIEKEYKLGWDGAPHLAMALQERNLIGRKALHAVRTLLHDKGFDDIAYSSLEKDEVPSSAETIMASKDYNDAVVHAMFYPKQEYMSDIESTIQKSGGYWLVTRNAVEQIIANRQTARGNIIPIVQGGAPIHDLPFAKDFGIDYFANVSCTGENYVIPVTPYDLPQDLLVVDTLSGDPAETIAALREAADLMPLYKNPEHLADALKAKSNTRIVPFGGAWPSQVQGTKDWQSRPSRSSADII